MSTRDRIMKDLKEDPKRTRFYVAIASGGSKCFSCGEEIKSGEHGVLVAFLNGETLMHAFYCSKCSTDKFEFFAVSELENKMKDLIDVIKRKEEQDGRTTT